MNLNGKEWVWEKDGKFYYSTSEYGYYASECSYEQFCYKQLAGAGKKVELAYSHGTAVIYSTTTNTSSTNADSINDNITWTNLPISEV